MNPILEVKNLNVTFLNQKRSLHAVRGIGFFLQKGESLGIIGESGCGKSAAIKALLNLHPPESSKVSGEIWYNDENLATFNEIQMQQIRGKEIGMIFQDAALALNPILKVGYQMIEGYRRHFKTASVKDATDAALEMLEKVGLPRSKEIMDAYPPTLSIGMCQRILIALTLFCKPKILLADEPTTGLDVRYQNNIFDLLKKLQEEEGISIVLITHDLNLAGCFCDRIMVMYAGKIVESSTANELITHPQHPYTKGLLNAMPRFDNDQGKALVPIQGRPPDLMLPLNYCSFCSRCPEAMNICTTSSPPLFQTSKSALCACFKSDPRYRR